MNQTERRAVWPDLSSLARGRPAALAMVVALAAGLWGQWWVDRRGLGVWSGLLLVAGGALFALLAAADPLERAREQPAGVARPRLGALALSAVLAAAAFPGFTGNRFRLLPTLAWLASLGLLFFACYRRGPSGRQGWKLPRQGLNISWHALALVGVLAVGAALRLWQLDAIPREMGVDMPHNYENARAIMGGRFMIFCPSYPGRESLFFYLLAAYSKVFGLGFFSIKFVCVLVGLATILALYGVGRYLFDREVGLVAAAALAVSKWHVILSRTGYRAVLVPLLVLAVIYGLARALRSGRGTDFALAGVLMGLGLYTYNAFLIVPALVAAALVVELAMGGRGALRRYGWGIVALVGAAVIVYLPLARYALESPGQYLWRVATRVSDVEVPLPRDLLRVFAGNLWRAAGMFNVRGDQVFYINVPFQRQLGAVSAVLFVFGLACALVRLRRGHYGTLLVFLGGLILPTALAVAFPHEVPSAVRAAGVIAPAYLLVGLPAVLLRRRLVALWPQGIHQPLTLSLAVPPRLDWQWRGRVAVNVRALAAAGLVLLGALELGETRRAYFRDYVRHLPQGNYAISLELARALDEFCGQGEAYIKVWPYWYDGNAVRAQLRVTPRTWNGELNDLDPARPPLSTARGQVMVIVNPQDERALQALRAAFPRWVAVGHRDYEGRVAFITFYGER